MKKIDFVLAASIGFLDGIFALFILKYLGIVQIVIPLIKIVFPTWILLILFPFLGVLGIFLASLIGKKIFVIFQAARFFLVGTLNTFIDLGVLYGLDWIIPLPFSSVLILLPFIYLFKIPIVRPFTIFTVCKGISFITATTNSYFWNKYWTFEKRKEKPLPKEFLKFLVITFIGFLINVYVADLVVIGIGPQFGVAGKIWTGIGVIIAAFFAFVWNFLGSKFIVFK